MGGSNYCRTCIREGGEEYCLECLRAQERGECPPDYISYGHPEIDEPYFKIENNL